MLYLTAFFVFIAGSRISVHTMRLSLFIQFTLFTVIIVSTLWTRWLNTHVSMPGKGTKFLPFWKLLPKVHLRNENVWVGCSKIPSIEFLTWLKWNLFFGYFVFIFGAMHCIRSYVIAKKVSEWMNGFPDTAVGKSEGFLEFLCLHVPSK